MQPQDNLSLSFPLTPRPPRGQAPRTPELLHLSLCLGGAGGSSHAYRGPSSQATSQPGERGTWPGQWFPPWECQTRGRERQHQPLWGAGLRTYILRSSRWSYRLPWAREAEKPGGREGVRQIPREERSESESSPGVRASGFSLLLWPGLQPRPEGLRSV